MALSICIARPRPLSACLLRADRLTLRELWYAMTATMQQTNLERYRPVTRRSRRAVTHWSVRDRTRTAPSCSRMCAEARAAKAPGNATRRAGASRAQPKALCDRNRTQKCMCLRCELAVRPRWCACTRGEYCNAARQSVATVCFEQMASLKPAQAPTLTSVRLTSRPWWRELHSRESAGVAAAPTFHRPESAADSAALRRSDEPNALFSSNELESTRSDPE